MIVQYAYIRWSPPGLTESQELELGAHIAKVGKEQFVREFRKTINKPHVKNQPQRTGIRAWPEEVRYIILVLVLGSGGVFLVRAGLAEQFLARLVPIGTLVFLVYYVSVFLAVRRFNRWADYLLAKYASHAARSAHQFQTR